MAAAVRGRLIRRTKVKELKEAVAIPNELRSSFKDGYDAPVVVETGRNKRRVCLAVSSGAELVVPDWLRHSIQETAAPNDEVSIYLSTRPIWFVEGEQDDAIAAIVTRYERARASGEPQLTVPVSLSPRLPNLDRISEVLEVAEGERRQ
jgi:hypothetical protein